MVVAAYHQHAALRAAAVHIAMLERIAGAVHAQAGTLYVSQSLASAAFTASGSGLILGGASGAAGSLKIDDGGSFTAGSTRYSAGTFSAGSAEFAAGVGTSASRLSTYATGKVTPSAAMLLRIEAHGEGRPG